MGLRAERWLGSDRRDHHRVVVDGTNLTHPREGARSTGSRARATPGISHWWDASGDGSVVPNRHLQFNGLYLNSALCASSPGPHHGSHEAFPIQTKNTDGRRYARVGVASRRLIDGQIPLTRLRCAPLNGWQFDTVR